MVYNREEIINYAPGGDSVKIGIEKLDADLTGVFTHLNTINADLTNLGTDLTNLGTDLGTDLTNHAADTSTHGVGSIVGVGEAQTLTNKTISLANNTVSGTLAQFNAAVSDADLLDTATAASTYIAMSSFDGDKGDISVSGSGSNWTVESVAGNLAFLGTGARITGDFSNATLANRTMFQTSTANAASAVGAIPNGTGDSSSFVALNTSDSNNAGYLSVLANNTTTALISAAIGTGTYLPMTFHTGGYERMRIDTNGVAYFKSNALRFGPSGNSVLYTDSNWGLMSKTATSEPSVAEFAWFKFDGTTELFRYDSTGFIVKQPSGLGYGIGAGGTVTQSTSKSTAVTLNKPCGQITMNNAALAAGATVWFNVISSVFAANDLAVVNTLSGNYSIRTANNASGYFSIGIKNETAGSLSEAVVINFAIIKGAIS